MARPKGIGGSPPIRKEPAQVPAPGRRDMLEQHISMNNRQEVPFESPMASFHRAAANMRERHDQARKYQQQAGNTVSKSEVMRNLQAECDDRQAMYHYKHHFTDMRGAQTVKRENIVVKKVP